MRNKEINIRAKRRDEKRSRALTYVICIIISILCILLDIYFVWGMF